MTALHGLDPALTALWTDEPEEEPDQALVTVLAQASREHWEGPGGRMFNDLHTCVSFDDDTPSEVLEVWRGLIGLVNPHGDYPSHVPDWLGGAREDTYKNLASPEVVRQLLTRIDSHPSALLAIVERCVEEGQEAEGHALESLVAFLRRCATRGSWVLGLEDGT